MPEEAFVLRLREIYELSRPIAAKLRQTIENG